MLFQQVHIVHHHAAVGRLAHVVNRQQGHLHGGQGFHFHAGGPGGFDRGAAVHAVLSVFGKRLQLDGHMRQGQRMAQGNEIGGLLGGHDAGQARNAQHIALACAAGLDQGQGFSLHQNASAGHGHPACIGFGAHIHHMGLALGVEMGQDGRRR